MGLPNTQAHVQGATGHVSHTQRTQVSATRRLALHVKVPTSRNGTCVYEKLPGPARGHPRCPGLSHPLHASPEGSFPAPAPTTATPAPAPVLFRSEGVAARHRDSFQGRRKCVSTGLPGTRVSAGSTRSPNAGRRGCTPSCDQQVSTQRGQSEGLLIQENWTTRMQCLLPRT